MNTKRPFYEILFQCLGQSIASRRKQLNMSQEELAAKTGVDRAFISNVERGKRNPSFGVVAAIARGLKMRMSRLAGMCDDCVAAMEAKQRANGGSAVKSSVENLE